jgi:hypothetical protein
MTYKREDDLLSNTLSVLHSQSDQTNTIAPTLRRIMYLLSIPCTQIPKTLAILVGGYKPETAWMIDHIERAKLYWKNKYFIVSS